MSTENIASTYNKFQNDFGTGIEQDYTAIIESLFTEDFTKVINGKVYVAKRQDLLEQLTGLRKAVNGWTIEEILIEKSPEREHHYVSLWRLHAGNGDVYKAEAVLGSDDGIRINSVYETAHLVEILGVSKGDL